MVTLQSIFYPHLAVVGIPSNIVTFIIFWRKNCMLSKPSANYLIAISGADSYVIVFIVVVELTLKYHVEESFWTKKPWCSLRDIFSYGAYNTSTWLVVTFTVECFVAINTVGLKAVLCTPHCALAADVGTMLDLSNAAVNMYLFACTQSKFCQEVVTCIRLAFSCWKSQPSHTPTAICHS